MSGKLYDFQEAAAQFHLDHHYTLNCSEMGLGKTRMALEAARRSGLQVAVFGPAFLQGTWEKEGREMGVEFLYTSYSKVHHVADVMKKVEKAGFWIADEVHYLKTPTTQRTHAFYSLLKTCRPEFFVGLTGTPIKNRVPDFWTLLGFCSLNKKGTNGTPLLGDLAKYYAFARHFCKVQNLKIAGRKVEKFGEIKKERIEELKGLMAGKYIRHCVADVLPSLPALIRKEVILELQDDPALEDTFQKYLEGSKVSITAKTASAKLKALQTAKYAGLLLEEGSVESLVIFSDHREPVHLISERIRGSVAITGETHVAVRQRYVDKFQRGEIKVLVATIGSLSVGVTLTRARDVIFNDLSWVPADNAQAEKRIHRIGQDSVCVAHYMVASPTDAYIQKTLFEKQSTIDKVVR